MDRDWDKGHKSVPFEVLKGKTIESIEGLENGSEQARFNCIDGYQFGMTYYNDCCASCAIEDICGDPADLIGHEILLAEEVSSNEPHPEEAAKREKQKADFVPNYPGDEYYDYRESETWVFYKLSTIKGSVTIRWYGSSNGYYSESASFEQFKPVEAQP